MPIGLMMLTIYLILCCPFLLLPSVFPGSQSFPMNQLFALGSQIIGGSASTSEYSGLISCRIDWFDILAVQGTLKSPLQHNSSKTSILQRSAFFTALLSHRYMTIGKSIALTIGTFVSKVMSLLFNMQSRFVTAFLPRNKQLLISWMQSPSTMIYNFSWYNKKTCTITLPVIRVFGFDLL